jgi:hypothetical protein
MRNVSEEMRIAHLPPVGKRISRFFLKSEHYLAHNIRDYLESIRMVRVPLLRRIARFESNVYVTLTEVNIANAYPCLSPAECCYVLKDDTGEVLVHWEAERSLSLLFANAIHAKKLKVDETLFAVLIECELHEGLPEIIAVKESRPKNLPQDSEMDEMMQALFPDYASRF